VAAGSECKKFRFEGGISTYIRQDLVKTLNARLEAGAPRDIISMELDISGFEQRSALKEVHLSAFFRPLEADAVECQDVAGAEVTRCYTRLSHASLQLAGVFDGDGETDFPAAMRELAEQVDRTVLSCN